MVVLSALNALGKRLTVEVAGEVTASPWYSDVKVVAPLTGREPDQVHTRDFTVSPRGNHDYYMAEELRARPFARLASGGGEFIFCASDDPRRQGLAMWRGQHHEISTYVPAPWARDDKYGLAWFEGLSYTDEPDGLVVHSERDTVVVDSLDISIAEVGYLYVHGAQSGLGFVPEHAGALLGVGELWKQLADDLALDHLIFASSTAVAVGSPADLDDPHRMVDLFGRVTTLEYEV
ncbi:hypothetical protein ABFU82_21865 [Nocardioides sp. WV_118_6]